MRRFLTPHPDTPGPHVRGVTVEVIRGKTDLMLGFAVRGDMSALRFPEPATPQFQDGLWQRTCLETFVRGAHGDEYCEINLSPSHEWAVYAFDGYRHGMRALREVPDPKIGGRDDEGSHEIRANLELGGVDFLAPDLTWRLGLSVVIEEKDGTRSYWALNHPPGAPDFHHEDCFALELPAPEAT